MTADPAVLACARDYARAGLSVIPIRPDGTKRPSVPSWKPYQTELPLADELDGWFDDGINGIAIICGHISGEVEVIDFEDAALFEQWCERVEAVAPGLLQRLPVIQTPRPGRHVYYRCSQAEGSQKLARSALGQTLIERKGEGGYVLAPGSPPVCHPTGRAYEHLSGPPLTAIPEVSADERSLLLAAARALDVSPPSSFCEPAPSTPPVSVGGDRGRRGGNRSARPVGPFVATERRVLRAQRYLARVDSSIQGQNGSRWLRKAACKLVGMFQLSREVALDLLRADFNPRCKPPWSEKELAHAVDRALTNHKETPVEDDTLSNGEKHVPDHSSASASASDLTALTAKYSHLFQGHQAPNGSPSPNEQSGESCPHPAPPQGSKGWGQLLHPVPASQLHTLSAGMEMQWIIEGVVARGMHTLFAGRAKDAGKTTFFSYLMPVLQHGGVFCGLEVAPARVLWISEESPRHWDRRRTERGIGDWVLFHCLPFPKGKPTEAMWTRYIDETVAFCKDEQIDLVGWDTITHLSPIKNENDNMEVATMLQPLQQLQQINVANLLLHHHGWGQERSRGASEYPGFVDFVVNYSDQGKQLPRRRLLDVKGRCDPLQLVVELAEDRSVFTCVEGPADQTGWDRVDSLLPTSEPGWSADEIHEHLPAGTLALHTIKNKIGDVAKQRSWGRTGEGKPHHPYRYHR